MDTLSTLRALNSCFGPSGLERNVSKKIEELAKPFADEITRDVMGNLIVHKKGPGPKVMFAAHMDSIGFIVTHITEEGYLRVGQVGYVDPKEAIAVPVRFKNGTLGAVFEDENLEDKPRAISNLYLDIGAKNREDAKERVNVGDAAVYNLPNFVTGEAIMGPYLDNRLSCVALLKALEQVKDSENDLYFVFTTQEEVGTRGAMTAAYAIDPDYAVVADVTLSDDIPGSKKTCSSHCGGGAAIKVMDSLVICHPPMVEKLRELAEEKKIPYQMDVICGGGTDGGAIHKSRAGVLTGGVSIPCRNTHCVSEAAYLSDVQAAADLMAAFAESKLEKLGK